MKVYTSPGGFRYKGPIQVVVPYGNLEKIVLSKRYYHSYSYESIRSTIQWKIFLANKLNERPQVDLFWIDGDDNHIDIKSDKAYRIYLQARTKDSPLRVVPRENKSRTSYSLIYSDIMCNGCQVRPILGYRYSCVDCTNYHLCAKCVLNEKHSKHTLARTSRPIKTYNAPDGMCVDIHEGIQCNICKVLPIEGFRYRCLICEKFNLCKNCENQNQHAHHDVVRLPGINFEPVVHDIFN